MQAINKRSQQDNRNIRSIPPAAVCQRLSNCPRQGPASFHPRRLPAQARPRRPAHHQARLRRPPCVRRRPSPGREEGQGREGRATAARRRSLRWAARALEAAFSQSLCSGLSSLAGIKAFLSLAGIQVPVKPSFARQEGAGSSTDRAPPTSFRMGQAAGRPEAQGLEVVAPARGARPSGGTPGASGQRQGLLRGARDAWSEVGPRPD